MLLSAFQGGPKFSCLSPALYAYLTTSSLDKALDIMSTSDLPDICLAETLERCILTVIAAVDIVCTLMFCVFSSLKQKMTELNSACRQEC